ncbi:ATP-binding protein, partial [Vibrio sp. 10N.286.49.E1]
EQLIREMEFSDHGVDIQLNWQGDYSCLSDTLKVTLFRLCQESLNNASKYANASEIRIELILDEHVDLQISDNGVGFTAQDLLKGMGVRGMQERVQALGGKMTINANGSSSGTNISVT